jgi:hypothetical protein
VASTRVVNTQQRTRPGTAKAALLR